MRREEIEEPIGVRWTPAAPSGIGVLVLAGSRGAADEKRARLFAEHGAISESVQWFGGRGQNSGPFEVPIELFEDRVERLAEVCDRVMMVGLSFGAEAALVTASRNSLVDVVVAFSPSDVVWAGVTPEGEQTSHWSVDGSPLPFVPFADDWEPDSDPPAYRDLYMHSRRLRPDAVADAVIKVERIPTVIQVVGGNDVVWPADVHAEMVTDRRAGHGLPTVTVTDPEAGHRAILPGEEPVTTGVSMQRGGTEDSDRRLGIAAWAAISPLL